MAVHLIPEMTPIGKQLISGIRLLEILSGTKRVKSILPMVPFIFVWRMLPQMEWIIVPACSKAGTNSASQVVISRSLSRYPDLTRTLPVM